MYIYTPLCRYWITLYRYVLVFIVSHVDIELEDNKQFISNIPRSSGWTKLSQESTNTRLKWDKEQIEVLCCLQKYGNFVIGLNDTSVLLGNFVTFPREREKSDRIYSRGDKREGQGRKNNKNESEDTEEIKKKHSQSTMYPYLLQG